MWLKQVGAFCLLCVGLSVACAESVKWNGFATLGAGVLDKDGLAFQRAIKKGGDRAFLVDSLVGVQLDSALSEDWSLTAQGLFGRTNEEYAGYGGRLEWLFLGYQLTDSMRLKMGRMRMPAFMLSETLEVGFSYPWVRPPNEMYGLLPANNVDGASLNYAVDLGSSELRVQAYGGHSSLNYYHVHEDDPTRPQRINFSDIFGVNLILDSGSQWLVRFGIAKTQVGGTGFLFAPTLNAIAGSGSGLYFDYAKYLDFEGVFTSLGVQYQHGNTKVLAELGQRSHHTAVYPDGLGGYVSLSHRFGVWTPYVYWAQVVGQSETNSLQQRIKMHQETLAGGIGLDVSKQSKLKFQVESAHMDEDWGSTSGFDTDPYHFGESVRGRSVMMFSLVYDLVF